MVIMDSERWRLLFLPEEEKEDARVRVDFRFDFLLFSVGIFLLERRIPCQIHSRFDRNERFRYIRIPLLFSSLPANYIRSTVCANFDPVETSHSGSG